MMMGLIGENITLSPHHEIQLLPSLLAMIPSEISQAHPATNIKINDTTAIARARPSGLVPGSEKAGMKIIGTVHSMLSGYVK